MRVRGKYEFTGQKIGKLLVTEKLPRIKPYTAHREKYKCVCDCGKVVEKRTVDLIQASKGNWNSSCFDCQKYMHSNVIHSNTAKSRIGEKYNRLKIVGITQDFDNNNKRRYKMVCKCDCGGTINSFYSELKRGITKSCGCYNREQSSIRGFEIGMNNYTKSRKKYKWNYIKDGKRINMRSGFEPMYALILDRKNIKWIYEPECFKLKDGIRYIPDFYLPETNEYVELKGFMNERSEIKHSLFVKDGHKLIVFFIKDIEAEFKGKYELFRQDWLENEFCDGFDKELYENYCTTN